MEKRKLNSEWRYFYALISAICLFILVFYIVFVFNYISLNQTSSLHEEIFYNFYKEQLNYSFFETDDCTLKNLDRISSAMDFQGFIVNQLESEKGIRNKHVLERKKYYYLLELSHFSLIKELNQKCDLDYNFILFFYSNSPAEIGKSEEAGKILNYIKNKKPRVLIYSFDVSSEDPLVNDLKSFYNITQPITVVVNEQYFLTSIENANQIISLLN